MRYRISPNAEWVYTRYSLMAMATVINNSWEYGIEGRDYYATPTHWGV